MTTAYVLFLVLITSPFPNTAMTTAEFWGPAACESAGAVAAAKIKDAGGTAVWWCVPKTSSR